MGIFKSEPVVTLTALGVLLAAVLQFLVTSGTVTVAPEQQEQLVNLINLVVAIVVGFVARSRVSPTS